MKISLIASLYNTDNLIDKWSKWLIKFTTKLQTFGVDFEIIIVSNEPTPTEKRTFEILKKYNWVKIIEVPRETIFASWNRGIKASSGEVYGFINADDIRFASSILEGIERIKNGADFVYFPFLYIRYIRILGFLVPVKIKRFSPLPPDKAAKEIGMPYGPFWLISKKFIEKVGWFDESFKVAGDFEWSARTQRQGKFVLSNITAGIFTSDGTTLSGSRSLTHKLEKERIQKMYFN